MENFKKLLRFAKLLEFKYLAAQSQTAQAGDVERVLNAAGLHPSKPGQKLPDGSFSSPSIDTELQNKLINEIGALLDTAGIPATSSVDLKINVMTGPKVSFTALINPSNATGAKTLLGLLTNKYSAAMAGAIKAGNLVLPAHLDPIGWLTISAGK